MLFMSWMHSDCSEKSSFFRLSKNHKIEEISIYSRLVNLKHVLWGKITEESKQELTTPVRNYTSFFQTSPGTKHRRKMAHSVNSDDLKQNVLVKIRLLSTDDVDHYSGIIKEELQTRDLSLNVLSDLVQDIYHQVACQHLEDEAHRYFDSPFSSDDNKCLMEDFEERLTRSLHDMLFDKIVTETQKIDNILSSAIENFNWVTTEHLSAHVVDSSRVRDLLDKAMLEIAAINLKDSTVEKLDCIMECSRRVTGVLQVCKVDEAGADEFFPVLVYVVLQANPANLHANIRYISQFSNSKKLMAGERGYYFTHLCSSVRFIENLDPLSLGLNDKEFLKCQQKFDLIDGIRSSEYNKTNSCYKRPSVCICKLYHKAAERTV